MSGFSAHHGAGPTQGRRHALADGLGAGFNPP